MEPQHSRSRPVEVAAVRDKQVCPVCLLSAKSNDLCLGIVVGSVQSATLAFIRKNDVRIIFGIPEHHWSSSTFK